MNRQTIHPAEQICTVMKRIYARQLTTLSGGNLSILDEEGIMWVSPSGIDKSSLTPKDVVQVLPDGSYIGHHKPTSEYLIHRAIYKVRKDIKAILHAHPPAVTSMSTLHQTVDTSLYPLAYQMNGDAQVAVYGLPGSMQLARRVAAVFESGSDTAILENHGVFLSSGKDIFQAFARFDELEANAVTEMNAYVLGQPQGMNEELQRSCRAYFQRPLNKADRNTVMTCEEKKLRRELSDTAVRAYENKLFTAVSGVVSARIDEHSFLISPGERDNAYLEPEDFVKVTDGKYEGESHPDGFARFVSLVYDRNPKIRGMIFSTAPYTMMFAVTEEPYRVNFIPECYGVLFSCREYSTEEFLEDGERLAAEARVDAPFALIRNIGAVFTAVSLHAAYDMLEVCENTAKSIHMARQTGKEIQWMTEEQLREMDGK